MAKGMDDIGSPREQKPRVADFHRLSPEPLSQSSRSSLHEGHCRGRDGKRRSSGWARPEESSALRLFWKMKKTRFASGLDLFLLLALRVSLLAMLASILRMLLGIR